MECKRTSEERKKALELAKHLREGRSLYYLDIWLEWKGGQFILSEPTYDVLGDSWHYTKNQLTWLEVLKELRTGLWH